MIKVSIIIPVYKVSIEYLRVCFNSLISQTLSESEFVIVSDGAPETEYSICEEYAQKDSRFKVFKREHAGVSSARNYGIEQAQGVYITFVDADDWIDPETSQLVYSYAMKNSSDIVLWDAYIHHKTTIKTTCYAANSLNSFSINQTDHLIQTAIFPDNIKESSVAFVSCKLIKKTFLVQNNIFFPPQLRCSEDRFFHIQCFIHSKSISYINKPLYHYLIHDESVSRKYTPDAFYEYTKFISFFDSQIKEKFSDAINQELIHSFFLSWPTCYMNPKSNESYLNRMRSLVRIVKTKELSIALKTVDLKKFPLFIRIELLLLKNGITLPIYIHGLKALLKVHR